MKKPGLKFFILQRLARQLRSWANLASRLSGMEDQPSFSVTTEELSTPVKDMENRERADTAGPPAHWLARIEARQQPAQWLSHVSTNKPAIQKRQERQNLQELQLPKEYINQESRTPSRSAPEMPSDDKERITDQIAQVTENAQEDVSRQATINSANTMAEHIVMNRHAPVIEKKAAQSREHSVIFAPISQLGVSSTTTPRDRSISPTTPAPSPWQEKVALPATPQTEQNPILQDQRAALVPTFRLQDQKSEPMQTVLPRQYFPEDPTPNRVIADRGQMEDQHNESERMLLQEMTTQKDNGHRRPQKRMPEQISQPDWPSLPPADKLLIQAVQVDSPSWETRASRYSLLGREPGYWAQIRPAEPVSQNQPDIPPQATMPWPTLPEDNMLNMTSDSQDLTLLRRSWERQQRLNEEQRGNLWNA